jgi:hypothetical protein
MPFIRLGDLVANPDHRVECRHRILEDLAVPAADAGVDTELPLLQPATTASTVTTVTMAAATLHCPGRRRVPVPSAPALTLSPGPTRPPGMGSPSPRRRDRRTLTRNSYLYEHNTTGTNCQ